MNDLQLWLIFVCFYGFGWVSASWWVKRRHRQIVAEILSELESARVRPETLR